MDTKALAVIQEHEKNQDLVFVRPEDLQTQRMFVPQLTVLHATPDDFHNISGQMMPKSYYTDRIGEAAGVSFIAEHCSVRKEREGENVYVGFAQGRRRLPDGTWRTSQVHEYEFDVDVRAQEDFLKKPDKYKSDVEKEKHRLEYKKFARQRAGTGARLKVIRELVGIPTSFKPQQMQKAIVVSRVAVNTDELLADPNLREAAIQQAVGVQRQLFGPGYGNVERQVLTEDAGLEIPAEEVHEPEAEGDGNNNNEPPSTATDFQDDIPFEDPAETVRRGLQHILDNNAEVYCLPAEPLEIIQGILNTPNTTLEALQDVETRIMDYITRKEQGNEKYAAHMRAMREAGRLVV